MRHYVKLNKTYDQTQHNLKHKKMASDEFSVNLQNVTISLAFSRFF